MGKNSGEITNLWKKFRGIIKFYEEKFRGDNESTRKRKNLLQLGANSFFGQ